MPCAKVLCKYYTCIVVLVNFSSVYVHNILSIFHRALHSNRLTELKTEWFDDTPRLQEL